MARPYQGAGLESIPGRGSETDDVAARKARADMRRKEAEALRSEIKARLAQESAMLVETARQQFLKLVQTVRHALDTMPSYLPSSLTPAEREACEAALRKAAHQAMQYADAAEARGVSARG
jgi:ABC-type transporter MlaC component